MLGTLQTMGTLNGIQHLFPFTHALSLDEHVWFPFFVLGPYLTVEIQEICLFYSWSNQTLPSGKYHFSAKNSRSYPGYLHISRIFS